MFPTNAWRTAAAGRGSGRDKLNFQLNIWNEKCPALPARSVVMKEGKNAIIQNKYATGITRETNGRNINYCIKFSSEPRFLILTKISRFKIDAVFKIETRHTSSLFMRLSTSWSCIEENSFILSSDVASRSLSCARRLGSSAAVLINILKHNSDNYSNINYSCIALMSNWVIFFCFEFMNMKFGIIIISFCWKPLVCPSRSVLDVTDI